MGDENKMRWNCHERGCFNIEKRPKIEIFAECFPGKIQMGDVDGIVEMGSRFLMLEWKCGGVIKTGQHIMYERITKSSPCHVITVIGDPKTMEVERYAIFGDGRMQQWHNANLADLKEQIRRWVKFVQDNPLNLNISPMAFVNR